MEALKLMEPAMRLRQLLQLHAEDAVLASVFINRHACDKKRLTCSIMTSHFKATTEKQKVWKGKGDESSDENLQRQCRRGTLFPTWAAMTGKAWSPTVNNGVRPTVNDNDDAEIQ